VTFLERLGAALGGGAAGLDDLWNSLEEGDHAGRLIVAHYVADAQEDLADEVRWDELALSLVPCVTDADLRALHPSLTILGFVPSLELNVADGYRRLGRFGEAAQALDRSIAYNEQLPAELPEQEAYRQLILGAQRRVGDLIAAGDSETLSLPKGG
jgi:hypothetical protein